MNTPTPSSTSETDRQPSAPQPGEIRTFQLHRGRMRSQRQENLRRLAPRFTVAADGPPLDPATIFGRPAPLVVEIGSGMGDATAAMAAADPDRDYLAVEVHPPGVAQLLGLIEAGGLTNLRVVQGDALQLLRQRVAPASLAAIHAFFPDPWPKQRHHKRRLFQPAHVSLLRSRLAPGGVLHTVTDWPDYARVIQRTLDADPELVDAYDGWAPRPAYRPETKYERKAHAAGRPSFELRYRRR
ncbi:tRNA (guanosine(46)-N7)-methyltransferase TrmB [Natronosporangium hydrolyticum]|uniref:tRNA (guanine-N(7)-)-methyltransferase n=1 Tax=Natronosporangium hydrolyticum TaxID=2811111 RepID=A0A895YCR0_9ACTN|nr:tRNA (guanosine(46)-N7)-methyltransferase TrmB [Natronosporangium hydrolyticum]QSB15291.1 tRNA (guanosine(46)-N7)-methyltransferase TrmB [Natronosporangium hydrolyticum]